MKYIFQERSKPTRPTAAARNNQGNTGIKLPAVPVLQKTTSKNTRPGTLVQRKISRPVVQRLKKTAVAYAKKAGIEIEVSLENVIAYVNNKENSDENRIGLLKAWNKGQKKRGKFFIATPQDLIPASVELKDIDDFSNWDSEDEDELDMPEVIKKRKTEEVTLIRGDGKELSKVPILNFRDIIRLGRQIVKRNEYHYLPFVAQIGPTYFEYNNPGTQDIYATPLTKDKKTGILKRKGTSQDFNYKNLVSELEKEVTTPQKKEGEQEEEHTGPVRKKRKLDNIFNTFYGESGKITEQEAETIGAISCDFMKGSRAIEFVKEAKEKVGESVAEFSNVFLGVTSFYPPARKKGRSLVTERTLKRKRERTDTFTQEVSYLINVNNCLINAIAQNHLNRNANLNELLRIRRRIGSVGNMLVASPRTIQIILWGLRIQRNVIVHYNIRINPGTPNETIGNYDGEPIHIFHTGGEHFEHDRPDQHEYY